MSPRAIRAINRFDDSDDAAATSRHTRETETNEKEEEGRRVAARVAHVAHAAAFDTGSILSGLIVPGEHTACGLGRPNGRTAGMRMRLAQSARALALSFVLDTVIAE